MQLAPKYRTQALLPLCVFTGRWAKRRTLRVCAAFLGYMCLAGPGCLVQLPALVLCCSKDRNSLPGSSMAWSGFIYRIKALTLRMLTPVLRAMRLCHSPKHAGPWDRADATHDGEGPPFRIFPSSLEGPLQDHSKTMRVSKIPPRPLKDHTRLQQSLPLYLHRRCAVFCPTSLQAMFMPASTPSSEGPQTASKQRLRTTLITLRCILEGPLQDHAKDQMRTFLQGHSQGHSETPPTPLQDHSMTSPFNMVL